MEHAFVLSQTVKVHRDDVRSVAFVGPQRLLTTSRDGTAKLTDLATLETTTLVDSDVFLNSSAANELATMAYIGAHDGVIVGSEMPDGDQIYLLGHSANVTCIATHGGLVASGSWDHDVRVWRGTETLHVLSVHTQNVWAVQFVDSNRLLTAGADKLIYLHNLETKQAQKFAGHSDAVRGLALLTPELFASVSNDATLRLWTMNGRSVCQVHAHDSFIYSVVKISDTLLATAGEDRTVRVWEYTSNTLTAKQTILLPSISQWCLSASEYGDIAVGSSDNTAHVFTLSSDRRAPVLEQLRFDDQVKKSAIQENEIDERNVVSKDVLLHPGKQEGQVVIVREDSGKLAAHQYSQRQWSRLGEVVGQNQESGSQKQMHGGKAYDYVFDVDIAEGQPPLRLPFNNGENEYAVAERFIAENNLPASYSDQIVQFLIRNSQSTQLGGTTTAVSPPESNGTETSSTPPAAASATPAATQQNVPIEFKYTTLHALKAYQGDSIIAALAKICTRRAVPNEFEPLIRALPSSSDALLAKALTTADDWNDNLGDLLPVYDLIRIAVASASSVPYTIVWSKVLAAIDGSIPKHTLLAVRAVVNMTQRADFNSASSTMLQQAVKMFAACDLPRTKPLAVAATTLLLNLAVRQVPFSLVQLAQKCSELSGVDAEADYRFVLALGVRSVYSEDRWQFSKHWLVPLTHNERIATLVGQIQPLLIT